NKVLLWEQIPEEPNKGVRSKFLKSHFLFWICATAARKRASIKNKKSNYLTLIPTRSWKYST
ncbi:MAG: hypothetical protein ACPGWR_31595, partial [Ardenticatenaceae bacterium]